MDVRPILQALGHQPASGWALAQRLQVTRRRVLYPALAQMERDGWIRGEWSQRRGERPQGLYLLTEVGREKLSQE